MTYPEVGVALACVAVAFWLWLYGKRGQLPPGPFPIPFFGNVQPASTRPGLDAWYGSLRAKYGDVFTVHLGMQPVVVVAGYDAIHELLIRDGDSCCVRDNRNTFSCLHDHRGLVWSAHHWLAQRKLTLRVWHDQDWRGVIGNESQKLVRWLVSHRSEDVSVHEVVQNMMAANLCSVLCKRSGGTRNAEVHHLAGLAVSASKGNRRGATDARRTTSEFFDAIKLNEQALGTLLPKVVVPFTVPLLRRLPGDLFGWKQFQKVKEQLWSEVRAHVREHPTMCGSTEAETPGDFIDAWLAAKEAENSADERSKLPDETARQSDAGSSYEDEDCVATILQLITAGTDALTSMVLWGLVHLIRSPECQLRLQQEIDRVIGPDRMPSPDDRPNMPYAEATITELLRISRGAFVTLPYCTQRAVVVGGHLIPPGTCVQAWLDSVHSDCREFEEPEQFRPERFLNEHGRFAKPERYLPFSLGKRSCIGEAVARTVAFLVFTTIFQKLSINAGDTGPPSVDPAPGFLWVPRPFSLKAELRHGESQAA